MEKTNIPCDKLKKLDEYAKSLGLTIYELYYGFEYEGETRGHRIFPFNIPPQYAKEHPNITKGFVQCI